MSNVSLIDGHIDYDKMTPQKALAMLNDLEFSEKYQDKQEYTDMLLLCKEALEKQIPKVAEHEDGVWSICPCCGGSVANDTEHAVNREVSYCEHCGQAIDWGNSEFY